MGLDMYLHRRIYVGANYEFNKITGVIDLYRNGEKIEIPLDKVTDITLECAYWRKANQIHNWFVENVQCGEDNCLEYYVPKEKLEELIGLCKEVLENKELASRLLPTQSGFFFGGTDYDEFYFSDLENTIKQIEPVLNSTGDFYYQSSW